MIGRSHLESLGARAVLALGLTAGCTAPTAPFTVATPTVAAITLDTTSVRSHGLLAARLYPAPGEAAPAEAKLQVDVTTDRGQVRQTYGPAERIIVTMKPGHSIEELNARLPSIRAHPYLTLLGGTALSLWVEPPPTARVAALRAGLWPGVLRAEPVMIYWIPVIGNLPPSVEPPPIMVWIPVRTGVAPDPAWYLTIESGETMTVSYTQPDGSQISASITWP
jgi:hypothetical protein